MVVFARSSSTSSGLIRVLAMVVEKQHYILSSRLEDPTDGA